MNGLDTVFYMAMGLIFLGISYSLVRRLNNLQAKNTVNERMAVYGKDSVIDMGLQLYNLTTVPNSANKGYVYVVKSDTGHYKIGHTSDPHNRFNTFNVKLPMEIDFIVLIKTGNMTYLETIFHQQYKHKRVRGEWFNLDRNDLLFLANYPGNLIDTYNIFLSGD